MMRWLEYRRTRIRPFIKLDPEIYEAYLGQYELEPFKQILPFGLTGIYLGPYELNPNRRLTVSREGDRLVIDIPRDFKSELFAESESKFFLKIGEVQLIFVKGEKGQVTRLEIQGEGQNLRAKRIK